MSQSQTHFQPVNHILIVGGGTAGWLTAAILASRFKGAKGLNITLVESADIPTVGVGEGTWPTMRETLFRIGLDETAFLKATDAAFKQGSFFQDWCQPGVSYYHPFTAQQGSATQDISPYFLMSESQDSYAFATCAQPDICELGLGPKNLATRPYQGILNYGYHLDAGAFATLLRSHCVEQLGVNHIVDTVRDVQLGESGDIHSIALDAVGQIEADLFIDCTGFKALLIGEQLGEPVVSTKDILFVDKALAVHVPYSTHDAPIATVTKSTAQTAGWVWDIGLQHRRGVGYVYSSQHQSEDDALATLQQYSGLEDIEAKAKSLSLPSGYRATPWKQNCVAIGLSAGFLEPLEASAIMMVESMANHLADHLPVTTAQMAIEARRFSDKYSRQWQSVVDFLKLHYVLGRREEPFWQDNREPSSIPGSLKERLALWHYRPPVDSDFDLHCEAFPAASYAYVLYGMKPESELGYFQSRLTSHDWAEQQLKLNKSRISQLSQQLLPHRELLNKLTQ